MTTPLILLNQSSPGDVLCMTAVVACLLTQYQDEFEVAVDSGYPDIWKHWPQLISVERAQALGARTIDMHYPLYESSNERPVHVLQGYCDYLEQELGRRIQLTVNIPILFWTNAEMSVKTLSEPYWVINAGVKQDMTTKQYGYYQEVVGQLKSHVKLVQVGHENHLHKPLDGALNLIGKTSVRDLIRLVYHSQGVISGISLLMHIAAALGKPAVVLAGGREPRSWNTYPRQTLLSTVGTLDCCERGGCWRNRTVPLNDGRLELDTLPCRYPVYTDPPTPACMMNIGSEEVVGAVLRYHKCQPC